MKKKRKTPQEYAKVQMHEKETKSVIECENCNGVFLPNSIVIEVIELDDERQARFFKCPLCNKAYLIDICDSVYKKDIAKLQELKKREYAVSVSIAKWQISKNGRLLKNIDMLAKESERLAKSVSELKKKLNSRQIILKKAYAAIFEVAVITYKKENENNG